jgi:hypothetical protein
MSSRFPSKQHLNSAEMEMLSRLLDKLCAIYDLQSDGPEAQRLGAMLVKTFQSGATREADLTAAVMREKFDAPLTQSGSILAGL